MVRFNDVSVWVETEVDGVWTTAEEYDTFQDGENKVITCYIESTEGAPFRIAYQDQRSAAAVGYGTWFRLTIDGTDLVKSCRTFDEVKDVHHFQVIPGYGPVSRPLVFSKVGACVSRCKQ